VEGFFVMERGQKTVDPVSLTSPPVSPSPKNGEGKGVFILPEIIFLSTNREKKNRF